MGANHMPYPLNNVTAPVDYSEAATAVISPAKATPGLVVTGGSIYYQLAVSGQLRAPADALQFGADIFVPPGRYFFSEADFPPTGKCAGIRVRRAVSTVAPQVSIY